MNPHPMVDATGTRRRLEALAAIGHTGRQIGVAMGRPPASSRALVSKWRSPSRVRIDTRIADHVAQVYDHLSGHPGPSHLVRVRALTAGCLPPAAWAGVDIDDPDSQPHTGTNGPDDDLDEDAA